MEPPPLKKSFLLHGHFMNSSEARKAVVSEKKRQRLINVLLVIAVLATLSSIVLCTVKRTNTQMTKVPDDAPLIFCYYTFDPDSLSPGPPPESLNAALCSHIIFGFAGITNHTLYPREKNPNTTFSVWRRAVKLKQSWPHLKVMLSVGATKQDFSNTSASERTMKKFVQSAVEVIQKFDFDGLDIDWEFPSWDGMPYEDRANYITLLKSLREAFDSRENFQNNDRILLTAAVASPFTIVEIAYDVPNMVPYLDYCLMMGYDLGRFNPMFPTAEFNSPLYRHEGQVAFLSYLNLAWSANHWLDKGMPREKLVVGVPFYGVTFKLADEAKHDVGSPVRGPGLSGGDCSYATVCDFIEDQDWTWSYHNTSRVPYAYKGIDWISYDNVQSIGEKVKWILDSKFAGVMTFDLNTDDFNKSCASSEVNFPLQSTVYGLVQEKIAQR